MAVKTQNVMYVIGGDFRRRTGCQ